uniref:Uncharacterized protein n=1 Tax=Anguilla anguilla TaxID=7936 RepID=A0A0E9W492_ANGAN
MAFWRIPFPEMIFLYDTRTPAPPLDPPPPSLSRLDAAQLC